MAIIFLIEQLHDFGAEAGSKPYVSSLLGLLFDRENEGCILPRSVVDFRSPESSVQFHHITMCYIQKDRTLHSYCCENEKLLHFIQHPI
jgi:hypothetical protein